VKTIRLLVVVISCVLLTHKTSHAEDPKSAREDFDLRLKASPTDPASHLHPGISTGIANATPNKPHPARLTSIGGPANKFRNITAINGTGIKRKP
jgi:hypothetical protein